MTCAGRPRGPLRGLRTGRRGPAPAARDDPAGDVRALSGRPPSGPPAGVRRRLVYTHLSPPPVSGGDAVGCSICGADDPAANRSCGTCGALLSSGCPTRGAVNAPTNRFCGTCGSPLAAIPADAEVAGVAEPSRRVFSALGARPFQERLQVALAGASRTARPAKVPAAPTTALSEAGS
ncbi:MAG: zinc ribbon domain-containing protein [Candidatus Limnocylindrales bacterium]